MIDFSSKSSRTVEFFRWTGFKVAWRRICRSGFSLPGSRIAYLVFRSLSSRFSLEEISIFIYYFCIFWLSWIFPINLVTKLILFWSDWFRLMAPPSLCITVDGTSIDTFESVCLWWLLPTPSYNYDLLRFISSSMSCKLELSLLCNCWVLWSLQKIAEVLLALSYLTSV